METFNKGEISLQFLAGTAGFSRRSAQGFMKTLKLFITENVKIKRSQGLSNKDIALSLGISVRSVHNHLKQVKDI